MKNKNKIQESMFGDSSSSNKTNVNIQAKDLPKLANNLKTLGKDVNVNVVEELNTLEPEAVIAPQDKATIKYLSNVKDVNTGKVSQPFTIADKNYQMVRGVYPDGNVDMAVYCLDDMDDLGNNIIYSVDEFEQKVALPMKERFEIKLI